VGRYVGIPVLILAAILDVTLMAEFRIGGGAPDLVFMLVVSWALLSTLQEALVWAVVGGVVKDALSVAPLGTSALGMVIVVFLVNSLLGTVRRTNLIIPLPVIAVGTVIYHLAILAVLQIVGYGLPLGEGLLYVTLPTMVYNMILILPVFRTMGLVQQWLAPRRVRLE
jgi:rod shape-determining protein MreD